MDEFKNSDPNIIPPTGAYRERVIVERESNPAVWWIVGILFAALVLGLLYFLMRPDAGPSDADLRVAQAEAAAENARQTAEAALVQNQINTTRDSVAIAQAQSAAARAEAMRAAAEARAAEARTAAPVVIERQTEATQPVNGNAVLSSTTPQPGN